mmetsp:Transcript_8508/g.14230  ORF Transcript_8508/g.14230 Transcript_8508/m.14230 type:complete len:111 (+) Transcript_8508:64-396(+)
MSGMEIYIAGKCIMRESTFQLDAETERLLSDYMVDTQLFDANTPEHDRNFPPHSKYVDIEVRFPFPPTATDTPTENTHDDDDDDASNHRFVVLGSDLTTDYVAINADYRS